MRRRNDKKRADIKAFIVEKINKYLSLVFIVFIVLLSLSFVGNVRKIKRANNLLEEKKEKLDKLREENNQLQQRLEKVDSEAYIEEQLRDKLGFVKKGETVVILPGDEVLRGLAPKRSFEEEVLPDSNWKRWLKLFVQTL